MTEFSRSLRHHHRPGSPRAAPDREQDVLRVQHEVRRAAQHADLPGVHRHARHAAGDEPQGLRAGAEDGPGPELQDPPVHQVGPEELLLSRPAQGLPDQPVRPAAEPRRLPGDQRSQEPGCHNPAPQGRDRAEEGAHHPRPPGGRRRQEHARRAGRQGRQPHRPEPRRHAAVGDRQPARPPLARRGQGLSDRAEAAVELPGRLRLQHAGREPAGGRQHQPPRPHARGQGGHADRGSQEHEQLPGRGAGDGLRGRAAVRGVARDRTSGSATSPRRPAAGTMPPRPPGGNAPRRNRATTATSPIRTSCP